MRAAGARWRQQDDVPKHITFQIADVHTPELSIIVFADMGFDCRLGKKGSYVHDMRFGR